MTEALTEQQFKAVLPPNMKKIVNPLLIMRVNNIINDPDEWEVYKENLLSYTHVLQNGKFKLEQYTNAVRYVSYKVMGMTNRDAYIKTFPEKYERFVSEGVSEKAIASYYTAYNKSKLVMLIYEQTLIPTHIINAPIYQKAINHQLFLMLNAKSETVQQKAADSLLNNLKAPETAKMELDVSVSHGPGVIEQYEEAMHSMVQKQLELMQQNQSQIHQITNAPIKTDTVIEGELVE